MWVPKQRSGDIYPPGVEPITLTSGNFPMANDRPDADPDLVAAAERGFLLLPEPVPEGVRLSGRVLFFDPTLDAGSRAERINSLLSHVAESH